MVSLSMLKTRTISRFRALRKNPNRGITRRVMANSSLRFSFYPTSRDRRLPAKLLVKIHQNLQSITTSLRRRRRIWPNRSSISKIWVISKIKFTLESTLPLIIKGVSSSFKFRDAVDGQSINSITIILFQFGISLSTDGIVLLFSIHNRIWKEDHWSWSWFKRKKILSLDKNFKWIAQLI